MSCTLRPSNDEMLRTLLRARIQHFRSQAHYAEHLGLSRSIITEVLIGRKPVNQIIAADLGFRRSHRWVPDR